MRLHNRLVFATLAALLCSVTLAITAQSWLVVPVPFTRIIMGCGALIAASLWASSEYVRHRLRPLSALASAMQAITDPNQSLMELVAAPQFDVTLQTITATNATKTPEIAALLLAFEHLLEGRLQAESHQARLLTTAEATNRAKSEFLANVSHEIRTPMNGVMGINNMLLNTLLSPEQKDYAEIVHRAGESLLSLVNDILDFSKIEAGKLTLEALDVDLHAIIEEVLELLAEPATSQGLELVGALHPDVPDYIRGDPKRLRQILTNLVGNAVKFTAAGDVVVQVTLDRESDRDAYLRFDVRDTGIGIPLDVQANLFTSFAQADHSTSRLYGGTGLGLAISKQLVTLMGGTINVDSILGKGSTFWFTIPLATCPTPQNARSFDVAALSTRRVLCIDDNPMVRTHLSTILSSWGLRVTCVANSSDALTQLQQAHLENDAYSIAFIDHDIAGQNGLELAREIKMSPDLQSTQLIMLMAFQDRERALEIATIGIAAALTKPIRLTHLYSSLLTAIGLAPPDLALPLHHQKADLEATVDVAILVAEDQSLNQRVLIHMLKDLGCQTTLVSNGREAVDAVQQQPYDCVLMDCQMPEMDGYDATRTIRHWEAQNGGHLPIIATTANAVPGDCERCQSAGMDDYLTKPVQPEQLRLMLQKWAPKPRLSGSGFISSAEAPITGPSSEPPGAAAALNTTTFEALKSLCPNDHTALVQDLITPFLEEASHHLTTLQDAANRNDKITLDHTAHALKGSCTYMGAQTMAALCQEIQALSQAQSQTTADSLACLAHLTTEFAEVRQALEAIAGQAEDVPRQHSDTESGPCHCNR